MSAYNFDFRPFGQLAVDPRKESELGTWIPVEGVRFLCLRAGGSNHRFRRANESAFLEVRGALTEERADLGPGSTDYQKEFSERFNACVRRIYAEFVVIDWEGIVDSDTGKAIPYSPEACLSLFDEVPDLFDVIMDETQAKANYMREVVEEAKDTLGKN